MVLIGFPRAWEKDMILRVTGHVDPSKFKHNCWCLVCNHMPPHSIIPGGVWFVIICPALGLRSFLVVLLLGLTFDVAVPCILYELCISDECVAGVLSQEA